LNLLDVHVISKYVGGIMPDFVTNQEVIQAARRNLSNGAWNYLSGGSESETTLRRNRLAFDRLAFRPRVLVDVSDIDTTSTFLGHSMRIPVILAPVGSQQAFTPEGGAAATKAADEFGVVDVVSSVTEPSLEHIASIANNPKVFQLYLSGDWSWTEEMVARIKKAGYKALCITVDTARPSRRDRTMLARWTPRVNFLSSNSQAPYQVSPAKTDANGATVTWDTIDRIKELAGLPFMLKGIATAHDATLAVEHGVDVIWVSNHGGRQLDHGLGTMDMLEEIVNAVNGKAQIVLDGGIQRGSDVLKAIALGANATAIGKLQSWGLAAAGTEGLVRALEILEDELVVSMGLLGVRSLSEVSSEFITKTDAVTQPHEMSSWVNMPESRIL
jgi:glycolate oxidase